MSKNQKWFVNIGYTSRFWYFSKKEHFPWGIMNQDLFRYRKATDEEICNMFYPSPPHSSEENLKKREKIRANMSKEINKILCTKLGKILYKSSL